MLGKKSTIGIFDCLEGQFRMLDKFPFIVGCMGLLMVEIRFFALFVFVLFHGEAVVNKDIFCN